MAHYDQNKAECLIFTYKEGLFSAVAHDLKLKTEKFEIIINEDEGTVSATFEVASIKVVAAQRNGVDNLRALSANDDAKIIKNLHKDVLKVRRNPQITFQANNVEFEEDEFTIEGDLKIEGRMRKVRIPVKREENRWSIIYRFNQRDFGIRPFSAMLGTIKIKPEIEIRISITI